MRGAGSRLSILMCAHMAACSDGSTATGTGNVRARRMALWLLHGLVLGHGHGVGRDRAGAGGAVAAPLLEVALELGIDAPNRERLQGQKGHAIPSRTSALSAHVLT